MDNHKFQRSDLFNEEQLHYRHKVPYIFYILYNNQQIKKKTLLRYPYFI